MLRITLLITVLLLLAGPLWSQESEEETPEFWLDEVIVVSDRSESLLKQSTTASSVVTQAELEKLPVRHLVDVLRYTPGITFVEQDASGNIPMAIVRGFFGGGEAEHLLLTVDGVPVNDLRNGLINWNQVPVEDIERIEITRGGGSAMYGDLALGAVINVQTRQGEGRALRAGLKAGQYGTRGGNIYAGNQWGAGRGAIHATITQADGYREHSDWQNLDVGGHYQHTLANDGNLFVRAKLSTLDKDDPGPLTAEQISADRRQANVLFNDDNRQRQHINIATGYRGDSAQPTRWQLMGGLQTLRQEHTRTLQVTPEYGDTQFHDESTTIGWAQFQVQHQLGFSEWIAGVDAEAGSYQSEYYDVTQTQLNSMGEGSRLKTGVYLESRLAFSEVLRATAGVRYDRLNNQTDDTVSTGSDINFDQVSPRIGINIAYLNRGLNNGHFFAHWSRAFKAPTLDQLYDRRILDLTDFFGQAFNFANEGLKPQESTNIDVGIYQQLAWVPQQVFVELSLSAYILEVDNEIDLNLFTFKYGNIQKTRHSGFEGAGSLQLGSRFRSSHTVNLMEVSIESEGDTKGNLLKNIPRHAYTNSVNVRLNEWADVTLSHRFFGKVYLDDENTSELPGFTLFDGRAQFDFDRFRINVTALNLADKTYNSSGYVFSGLQYLYPAQGRFFQGGIEFRM